MTSGVCHHTSARQVDSALSPPRQRRLQALTIEGYFSRVPPPPKPARPVAATPTLRTTPPAQTRLRSSPAPAPPTRTTTPPPSSHGDGAHGINSRAACFSHFHSRHCEINFSQFKKKRRRRARIGAEDGHRRVMRPHLRIIKAETQGLPTGYP